MASRSFKPASYLARPPFTRSSSSSSARSEDAIIASLKASSIDHKEDKKAKGKENSNTSSPGHNTSTSRSHFEEVTTPGRKRSAPIAIELPGREPRPVYTPLSARGDLPGGYFPNHEEIQRSYKSHPFHYVPETKLGPNPTSPFAMSDFGTPGSDATPRGHQGMLSPGFPPEVLQLPMGKYHPSNYKSQPTSSVTTPNTSVPAPFPSHNLTIPKSTGKRGTTGRPGHERRPSDVKRKIQQYQRDMIAQSRFAGQSSGSSMKVALKEPNSPKLLPCGSPGPITPFELEESAGYMIAGSYGSGDLRGGDADRQRQNELDMVDRMIETEERRARSPRARV